MIDIDARCDNLHLRLHRGMTYFYRRCLMCAEEFLLFAILSSVDFSSLTLNVFQTFLEGVVLNYVHLKIKRILGKGEAVSDMI